MNFYELLLLSLGLAMDAVAVSITAGFTLKHPRPSQAFVISSFFGGFQSLMPWIGWLAGLKFQKLITGVDHWIAFLLLLAIGGKMILEGLKKRPDEETLDPTDIGVLLMLSVATSVDALAAGISFAFLEIGVLAAVVTIGIVTFSLSFAAVLAGKRLGHFFENKIRIAGGVILIGIGAKILVEHLCG